MIRSASATPNTSRTNRARSPPSTLSPPQCGSCGPRRSQEGERSFAPATRASPSVVGSPFPGDAPDRVGAWRARRAQDRISPHGLRNGPQDTFAECGRGVSGVRLLGESNGFQLAARSAGLDGTPRGLQRVWRRLVLYLGVCVVSNCGWPFTVAASKSRGWLGRESSNQE